MLDIVREYMSLQTLIEFIRGGGYLDPLTPSSNPLLSKKKILRTKSEIHVIDN